MSSNLQIYFQIPQIDCDFFLLLILKKKKKAFCFIKKKSEK